jgi:hypothetical protein
MMIAFFSGSSHSEGLVAQQHITCFYWRQHCNSAETLIGLQDMLISARRSTILYLTSSGASPTLDQQVSSSDLHCYGEVQIERGRTEAGVTVIGACLTSKGLLVEG